MESEDLEIAGTITYFESPVGGLIASSQGEFIFDLRDCIGETIPTIGRACRFQPVNSNPPKAINVQIAEFA